MRLLIDTNVYSTCQRCERGATPSDPLIKVGQFVEWVILHKSCFDSLTKETEALYAEWRMKQIQLGKLPQDVPCIIPPANGIIVP